MDIKLVEIEAITNNFAEEQKVGSGGYGDVYRVCSFTTDHCIFCLYFSHLQSRSVL